MWTTALATSAKAVSKIVLICAGGAYLERVGVLHKDMRKGVSEAFVKLLLPCLLFTRILPTVSVETLPNLGWLALANVVYVTLGLCIGYVTILITRPPRSMCRILMAAPAIGHANSIPFMLVALIVAEDPVFEGSNAVGYVGLYLVMHSITLWGVGMNVLKKEKEDEPSLSTNEGQGSQDSNTDPQTIGRSSSVSNVPGQSSSLADVREQEWARSVSGLELGAGIASGSSKRPRPPCNPWDVQQYLPKWLNRPMAAAILAAVVGLIPGVKPLFVPADAAFNFLFGAMSTLGSAGPAVSLLAVGANFVADGFPHPSLVGYGPLAALILGRLLVLPALCITLWTCLRKYATFFPQDPGLMLVMCLECCTPTAYNLVTVCILNGLGARELSAGLFYQNLVAVVFLTGWTTAIMSFVI